MSTKKMSAAASSAKASAANVQSMGDKRTTSVNTVHTQSKRKNIVHSDDSDVEIIETSTPAKKKCVVAINRDNTPMPAPGSPAYQDLPAVSVSNVVLAAMRAVAASGTSVNFGLKDSVMPMSDLMSVDLKIIQVDKQNVARPERVKVKTEKALYAENAGVNSSAKESSLVKRKGKAKEAPPSPSHLLVTRTPKKSVAPAASPEESLEYEWPSTPPNTIKIEGNDNDVTWSDSEPDATGDRDNDIGVVPSDMLPKHDSQDVPAEAISAGFEEEDPTTQVMLKSIQDPALAPIYDGLPDLGVYRSVRQYAYVNTVGMGVVTLQNIQSQMGAEDISRLVRALLFTKSGFFVNPARASPNVFVADAGRLKLKEPSSVAVCIMTGIVTECAVISDGYTGGPDNEKTVHKVSLAPFRQDFRRDTTMWGKILSFDNLSCAISTEGLSFTTRPRTLSAPMFTSSSAGSVPSSPRTPRKGGSRAMTVMHSPAPARRSDNYITARTFEQRVPIYDGRSVEGAQEFTFSDTDFAKLSSWPLYERGLQDVPYDAVVSVGYTLNTFGEGPRGPNGLSTNLHFVILLALPNDLEA